MESSGEAQPKPKRSLRYKTCFGWNLPELFAVFYAGGMNGGRGSPQIHR
jgi:hypothetical protein